MYISPFFANQKVERVMIHKILMVDDDPKNLGVLGTILEKSGYEIHIAVSGKDAIEAANFSSPDLILLDVVMPGMNGFEVCRLLKENGNFADVPVIFLTSKTEGKDIEEGFRCGGVDYVTKPFRSAELLARIQTHLSLRDAYTEIQMVNQKLEQEFRRKQEFFHNISHELRTPTDVITRFTRFLALGTECDVPTESQKRFIKIIHKNADRLLTLIKKLLDIHHVHEEFSEMVCGPVSIHPPIRSCLNNLSALFDPCIKVSLELADEDLVALANGEGLNMVMNNLISNAAKYTEEGTVVLKSKRRGEMVLIEVEDTGIGMDQKTLDQIFERFSRSEEVISTMGSGLGLAITQSLVNKMNGKIGVQSKKGEGSTFWIELPVYQEKINEEEE